MIKCTSPYLIKLFIYLALIACMELHKCAVHAGLPEIKNRPTEQWFPHCPVATKKLVLYDK